MPDIASTQASGGRSPTTRYVQSADVDGERTYSPVTAIDLASGVGDAFGRLRVSDPQVLFDGKSIHDAQALLFDDAEASGGGTGTSHDADRASVTLSVDDTTAGSRVRQSKRRLAYQPGKSQLAFITFVMGASAAGITRRVGLFDESNGIFLEQTEDGVAWVIRSSVSGSAVDTNRAAQSSWNIDTLSSLDLSTAQIAIIDYEWLGVGTVRVGFVIDGTVRYVHHFRHANSVASVYMSSPNLPVRYEIANDGDGAASTLEAICCSVISEGGQEATGQQRVLDRSATGLTTLNDADIYPLIVCRLQSGKLGATVRALAASVMTPDTALYRWALLLNPTVAGTALSFSNLANSAIAYDVARTNETKVSGGTLLASGYAESTNQVSTGTGSPTDYALGSLIDGTSDILVLAVQRLSGTTPTFYGTLSLIEQV